MAARARRRLSQFAEQIHLFANQPGLSQTTRPRLALRGFRSDQSRFICNSKQMASREVSHSLLQAKFPVDRFSHGTSTPEPFLVRQRERELDSLRRTAVQIESAGRSHADARVSLRRNLQSSEVEDPHYVEIRHCDLLGEGLSSMPHALSQTASRDQHSAAQGNLSVDNVECIHSQGIAIGLIEEAICIYSLEDLQVEGRHDEAETPEEENMPQSTAPTGHKSSTATDPKHSRSIPVSRPSEAGGSRIHWVRPVATLPQWPDPKLWQDSLSAADHTRAAGLDHATQSVLESIPGAVFDGPDRLCHGPITSIAVIGGGYNTGNRSRYRKVQFERVGMPVRRDAWVAATDGRRVWVYKISTQASDRLAWLGRTEESGVDRASLDLRTGKDAVVVVPLHLPLAPSSNGDAAELGDRSTEALPLPAGSIDSLRFVKALRLGQHQPLDCLVVQSDSLSTSWVFSMHANPMGPANPVRHLNLTGPPGGRPPEREELKAGARGRAAVSSNHMASSSCYAYLKEETDDDVPELIAMKPIWSLCIPGLRCINIPKSSESDPTLRTCKEWEKLTRKPVWVGLASGHVGLVAMPMQDFDRVHFLTISPSEPDSFSWFNSMFGGPPSPLARSDGLGERTEPNGQFECHFLQDTSGIDAGMPLESVESCAFLAGSHRLDSELTPGTTQGHSIRDSRPATHQFGVGAPESAPRALRETARSLSQAAGMGTWLDAATRHRHPLTSYVRENEKLDPRMDSIRRLGRATSATRSTTAVDTAAGHVSRVSRWSQEASAAGTAVASLADAHNEWNEVFDDCRQVMEPRAAGLGNKSIVIGWRVGLPMHLRAVAKAATLRARVQAFAAVALERIGTSVPTGWQRGFSSSVQGLAVAEAAAAGLRFDPSNDCLFAVADKFYRKDQPPPVLWYRGDPTAEDEPENRRLVRNRDFTQWQCGYRITDSQEFPWRLTAFTGLGLPRVDQASAPLAAEWAHFVRHCHLDYRVSIAGTGDETIRVGVKSSRAPTVELNRQQYAAAFKARAFARWMELDANLSNEGGSRSTEDAEDVAAVDGGAANIDKDDPLHSIVDSSGSLSVAANSIQESTSTDQLAAYVRTAAGRLRDRLQTDARLPPEHLMQLCSSDLACTARLLLPRLDSKVKLAIMAGAPLGKAQELADDSSTETSFHEKDKWSHGDVFATLRPATPEMSAGSSETGPAAEYSHESLRNTLAEHHARMALWVPSPLEHNVISPEECLRDASASVQDPADRIELKLEGGAKLDQALHRFTVAVDSCERTEGSAKHEPLQSASALLNSAWCGTGLSPTELEGWCSRLATDQSALGRDTRGAPAGGQVGWAQTTANPSYSASESDPWSVSEVSARGNGWGQVPTAWGTGPQEVPADRGDSDDDSSAAGSCLSRVLSSADPAIPTLCNDSIARGSRISRDEFAATVHRAIMSVSGVVPSISPGPALDPMAYRDPLDAGSSRLSGLSQWMLHGAHLPVLASLEVSRQLRQAPIATSRLVATWDVELDRMVYQRVIHVPTTPESIATAAMTTLQCLATSLQDSSGPPKGPYPSARAVAGDGGGGAPVDLSSVQDTIRPTCLQANPMDMPVNQIGAIVSLDSIPPVLTLMPYVDPLVARSVQATGAPDPCADEKAKTDPEKAGDVAWIRGRNLESGFNFPVEIIRGARHLMPGLGTGHHKGQHGRVGVVGGCLEYTGAPYYAARAALAAGADLSFVFCAKAAALPIKCYSPELIVIPSFDADDDSVETEGGTDKASSKGNVTAKKGKAIDLPPQVRSHISRLSALVVGPGLGRSNGAVRFARSAMAAAVQEGVPIVVDADGLWILERDAAEGQGLREIIAQAAAPVVLTPNAAEFRRLREAVGLPETPPDRDAEGRRQPASGAGADHDGQGSVTGRHEQHDSQSEFLQAYSQPSHSEASTAEPPTEHPGVPLVAVLAKGEIDRIRVLDGERGRASGESGASSDRTAAKSVVATDIESPASGLKRVGGQGDVLAGTLATFLGWAQARIKAAGAKLEAKGVDAKPLGSEGDAAARSTEEGSAEEDTADTRAISLSRVNVESAVVAQELAKLGLRAAFDDGAGSGPRMEPLGYSSAELRRAIRPGHLGSLSLGGRAAQSWELGYKQVGVELLDEAVPGEFDSNVEGAPTAAGGSRGLEPVGRSGGALTAPSAVGRGQRPYMLQDLLPLETHLEKGLGAGTVPDVRRRAVAVACACAGASAVTRRSSALAFDAKKRGTTAPDVLAAVGDAMEELFPGNELVPDPTELQGPERH